MEDNELWARHLLALAYELIIAVYVLFRSLPSNLLAGSHRFVFFVSIVKCQSGLEALSPAMVFPSSCGHFKHEKSIIPHFFEP
ncbi:hypothetical protein HPP92_028510 [Vanilla planifolia]|uniref:DUF4220 domain-containing protein n=1 Tax=Vanilla planifolia TaxID=51239 RepID=A0A835P5H7_VANPL|nr:hypothetical protein HPP92_028510 [Vanilla planifolia]